MSSFRNFTAVLALALTVVSAPVLAQGRTGHAGYAARAQATDSVIVKDGVSNGRAQAVRACNDLAASFKEYTWGHAQSDLYRSCMAQRGQPE
jgi:hypothetical protein